MAGCNPEALLISLLRWRETPPLHGAHLLIIRIPKATAEIRREKGTDAYGAEGAEHATRAITHYKNPRVADGYVGP